MNPTLRTILAAVCIAVITFCAVLLVQRVAGNARLADLTEENLYTLSPGTRNILNKLNQPVTFRLYYAREATLTGPEQLRFWNNYYHYVHDLLEEFAAGAGGRIELEVIDPQPYSEEEEEALQRGLHRELFGEEESFIFGLVASTELGKTEVIEFFSPTRQQFVEYDVAKLLTRLMQPEKRTIGILSPLPVAGDDLPPFMRQMMQQQGRQPQEPWSFVVHLRQEYEVRAVSVTEHAIPDDIHYLMVIQPKDLSESERFAIDQYVMKGGKLLVFLDAHCLQDQPPPNQQNPMAAMGHQTSSDLSGLLSRWGVAAEPGVIATDPDRAVTVTLQRGQRPSPYPAYLELTAAELNEDEVISGQLASVRMLFPAVLQTVPGSGANVRPLLHTSKEGRKWRPSNRYELFSSDAATIREAIEDQPAERLMLACLITGTLQTNFPDGFQPPPESEEEDSPPPAGAMPGGPMGLPPGGPAGPRGPAPEAPAAAADAEAGTDEDADEGAEDATEPAAEPETIPAVQEAAPGAGVVVFADVDMISDLPGLAYSRAWYGLTPTGDNAALVFNALDYLAGSEDLISIRSRGRFKREFEVFQAIRAEAERETEAQIQQLQAQIEAYNEELTKLESQVNPENMGLLQSQAVEKYREFQAKRRQARRELRLIQSRRLQRLESEKAFLSRLTMFVPPAVILLVALALFAVRVARAYRYAARRT